MPQTYYGKIRTDQKIQEKDNSNIFFVITSPLIAQEPTISL